MWMKRLVVLNQMTIVLGCVTQLLAGRRSAPPTKHRVAESLLCWSLPLNLGVLETFFFVIFVRHLVRGNVSLSTSEEDRVRAQVAVAHLAFGVLGLLAIRFRGMFWFATIIGQAILLIGIAAVNGREMFKSKMSMFDVLMSLAHLGLLKAYDPLEAARPRPVRRMWFVRS
jgi:hypothetical protein